MLGFPTGARALSVALCVACLGAGLGARAERVAAAPPRMSPTSGASLREGFRASLAGGLAAAGHEAVSAAELDRAIAGTPALAACDTDVCLLRLGQLIGARALMRSSIELVGSSNYVFAIELYDVRGARVLASIHDSCSICTVREANEALSRAAASLGEKLARSTAPAPPPPPPASVERSAPAPRARTLSTPRSRLYTGLGVGALVLGLGAAAGGASLLVLDGRVDESLDPVSRQPVQDILHTRIPGIVLVAASGLFIAGGGVLLWRGRVARAPTRR